MHREHNEAIRAGLNLWNAEQVQSQLTAVGVKGMLKEAIHACRIKPQPHNNSSAKNMTKSH